MLGTIVNVLAILAGAVVGMLFGSSFSEKVRQMIMQAIGLGVILIGLQMAITSEQLILVIVSMVLGAWIGETLDIEGKLLNIGEKIESRVLKGKSDNKNTLAQAFVTSTLLYCIGAMAIMGAIESGLTGNHDILYAKSLLDGVTAIMLTSSLGFGVAFSAIPVLIYQGGITLFAASIESILTPEIIIELKAVGGLTILGIGLNILNITKIKIGNLLPALVIIVFLMIIIGNFI